MQTVLDQLRMAVGDEHVLVEQDQRAGYEVDWTGRYGGRSIAVVRPGSTDEVRRVVRSCAEHGVVLVPQGGNTGLVGGSVPRAGDGPPTVVVSLRRLDHVGEVDRASMQIEVGSGATLAAVADRARAVELDLPVDFAARDTATIGGAIATNAGGSRVLRFGTMRRQVVGIRAVLASGELVGSLAGLPKESAGLHWPSLLAGSEGTLAIVTDARIRLVPHFAHTITAMVTTLSLTDAVQLLGRLRAEVNSLDSLEIVFPEALALVARHLGRPAPAVPPEDGVALLVECAAHDDPTDELLAVIARSAEIVDSVVTADAIRRRALVEFRDRITEAIATESATIGAPTFKLDVAVPVGRLHELVLAARRAANDDGCHLVAFGHLAEGNLHLNHLGAKAPDTIAERVLRAVAELDGTISAEHGIGIAKARHLPLIRSRGELEAHAAIKSALDPGGLLNPGVLGLDVRSTSRSRSRDRGR